MTDPAGDTQLGATVAGRYRIESRLSEGAMGTVYRARSDDGPQVAIKRLVDPEDAARFEIEARLLSRLDHPRIVRVVEHVEDEGSHYLVMDLVEGPDLNRVMLERGEPGLPVEEVLEYVRQASEALQYVHEQNVVHRDVKPHNLIRGADGIVLVDFGIAREGGREDGGTRAIGTPLYMAPEVLVGEEVSGRSDVYSLGATAWALLSGKPPAYDDPKPLAEAVDGVTPELERALRAALAIRPERRLASAASLAGALGVPLAEARGRSLALSAPEPPVGRELLEGVVRTAAGVLDAAAASIALIDPHTGELVYQASWGAGAEEIVGVRLPPGEGIAGSVVADGEGLAVPDCRTDPRFAESVAKKTGYVPHTMLLAPLERSGEAIGVLSVLDRRDGGGYGPADVERAILFAELAVTAIDAR